MELKNLFVCDSCEELVAESIQEMSTLTSKEMSKFPGMKVHPLILDEEMFPFKSESLDMVVSNMNMHYVNDLSVGFSRILDSLRSDGTHIGITFSDEIIFIE